MQCQWVSHHYFRLTSEEIKRMVKSKSNSSGLESFIGLILMMALIFLLVKGCQFANNLLGGDNVDKVEQETKPSVVVDGQNGYLVQDTFVAIDEENFDELYSYIAANNTNAIIRRWKMAMLLLDIKVMRLL